MSWSIAFTVAFANALLAFVITVVVGLGLMHLLNIHDRDGGGSMGVFFVFGPFAAAVGFVWGLIATGILGTNAWPQFWRAFTLAQLLPNALVLLFFGFKMLTRPVAPTIDGHALELEAEVFVPEGLYPEEALRHEYVKASLYAGDNDNAYITVDRERIALRDGQWVIPLRGRLNTVASFRMLTFIPYDRASITLDMVLPARPMEANTAWSEPYSMRKGIRPDGTYEPSGATVRYRVVKLPKVP
ncbi:MAG: hypothetical protein KIT10_01390 [Flavobacteriales bacterium]|nr:hypothetical protein [Flavobacteriales bacterium]